MEKVKMNRRREKDVRVPAEKVSKMEEKLTPPKKVDDPSTSPLSAFSMGSSGRVHASDCITTEIDLTDEPAIMKRDLDIQLEKTRLLNALKAFTERSLSSVVDNNGQDEVNENQEYKKEIDKLRLRLIAEEGRVKTMTDYKLMALKITEPNFSNRSDDQAYSDQSQKTSMKMTEVSVMINASHSPGLWNDHNYGIPMKKDTLNINDNYVRLNATSTSLDKTHCASPVPSTSSSSSYKRSRELASLKPQTTLDDSGYRACKFRNSQNDTELELMTKTNVNKEKKRRRNPSRKTVRAKKNEETDTDVSWMSDGSVYCICKKISYGKWIKCDNDLCPLDWFHFKCVGVKKAPKTWYCPKCRLGENSSVKKSAAVLRKQLLRHEMKKRARI